MSSIILYIIPGNTIYPHPNFFSWCFITGCYSKVSLNRIIEKTQQSKTNRIAFQLMRFSSRNLLLSANTNYTNGLQISVSRNIL